MDRQNEIIKQAVILAGGKGERLRPLTDKTPKPMVLVNNHPFLEYPIEVLQENGIEEIILLVGYFAEKIIEYFGDGNKFSVNIKYSISPVGDDTGTRIRKAKNLLNQDFLLMYGDVYWPALDLKKMSESYYNSGKLGLAVVCDKGENNPNFEVDNNDNVLNYIYGREANNPKFNWTEVGIFILSKKITDFMPKTGDFNFNKTTLPDLVTKNQLIAWKTNQKPDTITSPEHLFVFAEKIKKVIFLDRDGVINKQPPAGDYIKRWEEFEFLPDVIEALQLLTRHHYDIFIVTNQRGVALNIMTKEALEQIHASMIAELRKYNVEIKKIYYCPHGKNICECRKPKTGMFLEAMRDYDIDLAKIIFIGNEENDRKAGEAIGCRTIIIKPPDNLLAVIKKEIIKI